MMASTSSHEIDSFAAVWCNGDRAFWHDVGDEFLLHFDENIIGVPIVFNGFYLTDSIDMSLNNMAFKSIAHGHCRFNMHFIFIVLYG